MKKEIKKKKIKQYELLINARNFHYDNFNKWMTYYYVAMGALFVGYCTLKSENKIDCFGENSLVLLGFLVGLFWYWSCKGYYYWNINFITLVNNFEKKILKLDKVERVYFVFANKNTQNNYLNPISGANISTSKVTILFSFTVTSMWGVLFLYNNLKKISCLQNYVWVNILLSLFLSISIILIISSLLPKRFLYSKIDHFPDLKIKQD